MAQRSGPSACNSQSSLGFRYTSGDGVKQDYAEAVRWWRMAAEQGKADAQSSLGYMYDQGNGVQQDYAQAVRWSQKFSGARCYVCPI